MKGFPKSWILIASIVFTTIPMTVHAQDSGNAPGKSIQMVSARASLSKTIDAKKAKQGDAITAKLDDDVKISGEATLPRNTVLLGHIDQVQPSENKSDSLVQVTFDKAQLKNGQQLPIKATIMQISAPASAIRNQDTAGSSGPSSPGGAGGTSGGGLQSQAPQSAPHPTPSVTPNMPDSAQPSPQLSGITGVQLQSDIHQSNSGVFTAKKRNVHIDDGTQLQLAIAVIPPNSQVQ